MRRCYFKLKTSDARLETLHGATVRTHDFRLFTRDVSVVCLYLQEYDFDAEDYVPFAIADGTQMFLGIKASHERTEGFLASSVGAAWNQSADWDDLDLSQGRLCVRVNCNTTEMLSLFSPATVHQDLVAEVQMIAPGESEPSTLAQWPCRILQDIIQGVEGTPASVSNFAMSGPTSSRPTAAPDGWPYLDTDLGFVVFRMSSAATGWVNATGAEE